MDKKTGLGKMILSGILALALTGCSSGGSGPAPAEKPFEIVLEEVTGDVEVEEEEKSLKGTAGMVLHDGNEVSTDKESTARIMIGPKTILHMAEKTSVILSQEEKTVRVTVKDGSVFFCVKEPLAEDEGLRFEVKDIGLTTDNAAGVIETEWGRVTTVRLLAGEAEGDLGGQAYPLPAGTACRLTDDPDDLPAGSTGWNVETTGSYITGRKEITKSGSLPDFAVELIRSDPAIREVLAAAGAPTDYLKAKEGLEAEIEEKGKGPVNEAITKEKGTVTVLDEKGVMNVTRQIDLVTLTADRLLYTEEDLANIDAESDDGKYYALFRLFSAFNLYREGYPDLCMEMLRELTVSSFEPDDNSSSLCRQIGEVTEDGRPLAGSFFAGADAANGYTPSDPLTLTMHSDPLNPQHAMKGDMDVYIETVYVTIPATGEEKKVSVYRDPENGKWYIWSGITGLLDDD